MKVSAEAARCFLVARHFLAPARSLQGGPDAVMQVFRRLGSIQYDPIAVAGRTHDLFLHARVADYDPAWCDELYEKRQIFEAYNKGLSLVPADELPRFRTVSRKQAQILEDNADVARAVLERFHAEKAPLSVHDFERQKGTTTDWFGAPTNTVRAVLEAYTVNGVLGLAYRDGNRRYYDLTERLLPKKIAAQTVPDRERVLHKLLSRYRAHGLLGDSGGGDIFQGIGTGGERRELRTELVERGELVPVEIDGLRGKRYVIKADVELIESPPEPPPSVAFLPPFDALVWDRKFLQALFGFEYVWELFHPPEKRRWGWYVLPIVFRDRFVGRIEPRIDAAAATVEVLNVWWEEGFDPRRAEGFVEAMQDALAAYARFARATRVVWPSQLGKEKRLFAYSTA